MEEFCGGGRFFTETGVRRRSSWWERVPTEPEPSTHRGWSAACIGTTASGSSWTLEFILDDAGRWMGPNTIPEAKTLKYG